MNRENFHGTKELILKQWDGYPLYLGLMVEEKPITELFHIYNAAALV